MNHTRIACLGIYCLFLFGCGSKWTVANAKFFKFQNHDVRVAAKISLSTKAKPGVVSKNGVEIGMRLYTGEFGAVLTEINQTVGDKLEGSGSVDVPEVDTIAITDFRLGGTPNTYQDFCAEIKVDNSNIPDWTKLGCVHFTDTPLESPTGGVESAMIASE